MSARVARIEPSFLPVDTQLAHPVSAPILHPTAVERYMHALLSQNHDADIFVVHCNATRAVYSNTAWTN